MKQKDILKRHLTTLFILEFFISCRKVLSIESYSLISESKGENDKNGPLCLWIVQTSSLKIYLGSFGPLSLRKRDAFDKLRPLKLMRSVYNFFFIGTHI